MFDERNAAARYVRELLRELKSNGYEAIVAFVKQRREFGAVKVEIALDEAVNKGVRVVGKIRYPRRAFLGIPFAMTDMEMGLHMLPDGSYIEDDSNLVKIYWL